MLLAESITDIHEAAGEIVVTGSHGGDSVGRWALANGVGALVCHDAGIGLDGAGVAALLRFDGAGAPAVAADCRSARIGDPQHMLDHGLVSCANTAARALGIELGWTITRAVERLAARPATRSARSASEEVVVFSRREFVISLDAGCRSTLRVVLLDSASLASSPDDDGAFIVTGSHGGLPGNRAERAMKAIPVLAVFNDAGIGFDNAGIRRIDTLQQSGIAGACVHASSAHIGDAESTYQTGVISALNIAAERLGIRRGMAVRKVARRLLGAIGPATDDPSHRMESAS